MKYFKILKKLNINITTLLLIIVVMFFVFYLGVSYHINTIKKFKIEIADEVKLRNALNDTINIYQNKSGEWVAEKLTLQADIKVLRDMNSNLTQIQKNLLKRIDDMSKDKMVIMAALIEANAIIEAFNHSGKVLIKDSTITFIESGDFLEYELIAKNVRQIDTLKNVDLLFKRLFIPNEIFIEFHWELNKRENFPVGFSVTNSSPYMRVNNIESYAIPEIRKDVMKPNKWENFKNWTNDNVGLVIKISAAGTIGYLIGRSIK